MPDRSTALRAIVRAEFLLRFRRTSSIIILLAVAAGVYFIVPEPSSGHSMIQVEGHHVLQNSAAVALATGLNCSLLLSLFGYYLVSNSLRREILSHTASVVAATRVGSLEYLTGKFIGNVLFLAVIGAGCMLSAMAMFLLRGEGTLEPLVFLATYTWLLLPMVAVVAAIALLFESVSVLSGRVGDVLYFFIWGGSLGAPVAIVQSSHAHRWLEMVDILGLTEVITQLTRRFNTENISIGFSTTNRALAPMHFAGLEFGGDALLVRLGPLVAAAVCLLIARAAFHRFDPVRIKRLSGRDRWDLRRRIELRLKPATGWLVSLTGAGSRRAGFSGAVRADVIMTLLQSPLILVAVGVFLPLTLFMDLADVRTGVLPAMVVVLVIALSDIASRDPSAGMLKLLCSVPRVRERYVLWKFCSSLAVTLLFTAVPLVRLGGGSATACISLAVGTLLLPAAATGMGVLTGAGKLFIVTVLMLLDAALNAQGVPGLDFFGCYGIATPATQAGYFGGAVLLLAAAHAKHAAAMKKL